MANMVSKLFNPKDGTRKEVLDRVVKSREGVQKATNRLNETIADLLDKNDELTKRQVTVVRVRKD